MGLTAPGELMNDPKSGQILYNSCLSQDFKFKLGHNVKLYLFQIKAATGKDIAEHGIGSAKVIPTTLISDTYASLPISILKLLTDLRGMIE